MADETLELLPVALHAASGIIAKHAAHAVASGSLSGSAEMSGVAAAAMHAALRDYGAAFSERLSSASAALVGAAGSFTAMENANRQALASIAPGDATVREC